MVHRYECDLQILHNMAITSKINTRIIYYLFTSKHNGLKCRLEKHAGCCEVWADQLS
jgi:hypothetical protein